MSWLAVSAFFAAVSNIAIGTFVLSRSARSPRNTFFACMTFCLALWASVDFLVPSFHLDHGWALRVDRISYVGASFVPATFLCFVLWLVERPSKPIAWGCFGASTLFALLSLTPLIIADIRFQSFQEVPGPIYPGFVAFFAGCLCYGLWFIWQALRLSNSAYLRNQLRYVWVAAAAGLIALIVYALITYRWKLPPIHYLIELGVVLTLAYAIVRHRLMDVNVAITRIALFLVVYVPMLLLPFLIGNAMETILKNALGPNWWMLPMAVEALFAVSGLAVYRFVQRKAEDRLLAEQHRYQAALRQASQGMTLIKELDRLLEPHRPYPHHEGPIDLCRHLPLG
jgi:hypothetical protein